LRFQIADFKTRFEISDLRSEITDVRFEIPDMATPNMMQAAEQIRKGWNSAGLGAGWAKGHSGSGSKDKQLEPTPGSSAGRRP
jgi:hypothetical protein